MAFHRPKHVLMYVFLFILSTMALSLIYKTIQISEETKKEATLIEESNKCILFINMSLIIIVNYVELPNGQYLYQRKDSGSFTPHAFCIAGSRMNRLLSPELFNLTNTYFLQVSDPDLFIWGYYDTDTFDIDQLFNLFGHRIAGLHLSKYDPKNMEFVFIDLFL